MTIFSLHTQRRRGKAASIAARLAAVGFAAASVIAISGCAPVIAGGPMSSEERTIEAVTRVTLSTAGDLTISEGSPSLVIHAPQDALERLTSEVQDDTLTLGATPGTQVIAGEVRYELALPDLDAIAVDGSGDVDADVSGDGALELEIGGSSDVNWIDLQADSVQVILTGSGDIELAGETGELSITLDGSGNIDASGLDTGAADVSISGSGDIDLSVRETLSAEISGSGRVTYSGEPTVSSDVSGSGEVVPK